MAAIEAYELSKHFRLLHEKRTTIKEYFLHPFHRSGYDHNDALVDVSFTVGEGEFFSVIGPNGSGKSTLMKIIAGIYRQNSGVIRVNGKLSPFIELGVGFNTELPARDNVRINATLLGLSKRELEERYDSIVAFAELERFMDQKLKNFSSGMQVRLAYSIAIQVSFDVLLLDEVLAVGDGEFQEKCLVTFEEIRAAGKTIVFVSHDLAAVKYFSDRVLYLDQGRQVALGPPEDVIARYAEAHGLAELPF